MQSDSEGTSGGGDRHALGQLIWDDDDRLCTTEGVTLALVYQTGEGESRTANAARLALCWNCHDDLVTALDRFVGAGNDAQLQVALVFAVAALASAEPKKEGGG